MSSSKRYRKFPVPEFLPKKTVSGWREDYIREVFFLTLMGATDVQIAQTFGVSVEALDKWKRSKPEFLRAMKAGKTEADAKVVHSLYLAAIGYSHPDQVVIANKVRKYDEKGRVIEERTEPLIVNTIKNYPPNVTAAVKWLQARQPDVWGNKLRVEGKVDHSHKLDLSSFSEEELEVIKKLGTNQDIEDADYEVS